MAKTVGKRGLGPTKLFHLRIPERLRAYVDLMAAEEDTTAASQLVRLLEFGLHFQRMTWGTHRELMTALYSIITLSAKDADTDEDDAALRARLDSMMDTYFNDRRESRV